MQSEFWSNKNQAADRGLIWLELKMRSDFWGMGRSC